MTTLLVQLAVWCLSVVIILCLLFVSLYPHVNVTLPHRVLWP
jgi:hypothetical protein